MNRVQQPIQVEERAPFSTLHLLNPAAAPSSASQPLSPEADHECGHRGGEDGSAMREARRIRGLVVKAVEGSLLPLDGGGLRWG